MKCIHGAAMTRDLRSWWEPCSEESEAAQHVLNRADSWLSTTRLSLCVHLTVSLSPVTEHSLRARVSLTAIRKPSSQSGPRNSYRRPLILIRPLSPSLIPQQQQPVMRAEGSYSIPHEQLTGFFYRFMKTEDYVSIIKVFGWVTGWETLTLVIIKKNQLFFHV